MNITPTPLIGLYTVDIQSHADERGTFARTWDAAIAKERGLQERFDYTCISTNVKKHTLRGMHYQKDPHGEIKLVRCTKGSVYDVAIDLRPDSPTHKQWFGVELSAQNHRALYIPEGFAHGFLTLEENAEVLYAIAHPYVPNAATGVRFNDPAFSIDWPAMPDMIDARDASYPPFA